jgi:PelA/Pel-15E family pectate lyase
MRMNIHRALLTRLGVVAGSVVVAWFPFQAGAELPLPEQAATAMHKAATFFRSKVASHGGYVYYYSLDLTQRWGEGKATAEQIWVQPPGTPTVGLAYLRAFEATGDRFYLDAAREAAEALFYGQLASGGWTNAVDFDPAGKLVAQYRNGKGRGRNYSTLDDGISQGALRLIMHVDRALGFNNPEIHEASEFARSALLAAQFPSGGFPQAWSGPVVPHSPQKASYPEYDWRTENRIKEYWDLPTLNDGLAGQLARALLDGWEIYQDERCRDAVLRLGDFLLLAQMPEPQPGWAQQYDTKMRPAWARRFEPPTLASHESMDALETLLRVHRLTGETKYLDPFPGALAWLRRSLLPDGRFARFYELQTNTPLYMTRDYQPTHSDADLPEHYGWKVKSRLDRIEAELADAKANAAAPAPRKVKEDKVREILSALDAEGRWISTNPEAGLAGNPKFKPGEPFIASEVFSKNLETLSSYVAGSRGVVLSVRQ